MSQDEKRQKEAAGNARRSTRIWIVSTVILIAAIMCGLAWKVRPLDSRSIGEKLAAIDAELAIPDSENAAFFYGRLFTETPEALADFSRYVWSPYRDPWADEEYPEEAVALYKHRAFIQELLDISQIEMFHLPFGPDSNIDYTRVLLGLHTSIFVLAWAGANDLAEGQPDAACEKYRCQVQIARHMSQQPETNRRSDTLCFAGAAYWSIKTAVMQDEITSEHLRSLESILEISMARGDEFSEITARVDRLLDARTRSKMSTIERLKQLWHGAKKRRKQENERQVVRLATESNRRAAVVLLAIRRHKERTGHWPETLERIEPKLTAEMLIDPRNNGPFGYRLSDDGFVLYTRGFDGIDEGGSGSDYAFWPRKKKYKPRKQP